MMYIFDVNADGRVKYMCLCSTGKGLSTHNDSAINIKYINHIWSQFFYDN
jgi:hypothetical protein